MILSISILVSISFVLTLLYFAYQYMWLGIETIPSGRVLVAIFGSSFSVAVSFVYCIITGILNID